MSITHSGFHASDGWYFERQGDGSVKISAAADRCTEMITLPPAAWASVVAAVCSSGETSETYNAAMNLHAGKGRISIPAQVWMAAEGMQVTSPRPSQPEPHLCGPECVHYRAAAGEKP